MNPDYEDGRTIDAEEGGGDDLVYGPNPQLLENGERLPQDPPPAGVNVPQQIRDYAANLRERIDRDPTTVPYPLYVWLAKYTKQHTDAGRSRSLRRAAFYEEFHERGGAGSAEEQKAKGERLDKLIKSIAVDKNAETTRQDVFLRHLTSAVKLGGDTAIRTVEAQAATIQSLGGTVQALTQIVSTFGGVAKEQYDATIQAINAYKAYSNGQPMPQGWDMDRIIKTAGVALEALAPAIAKIRLLEKVERLGVPMGTVDSMAQEKAKELTEKARAAGTLPQQPAPRPTPPDRRALAKQNQKARVEVINAKLIKEERGKK